MESILSNITKPYSFFTIIVLLILGSCTERERTFKASEVSILPKPNMMVLEESSFKISSKTTISIDDDEQKNSANYLIKMLSATTGFTLEVNKVHKKSVIQFSKIEGLQPGAYELYINPKKITIKASDESGYFYGIQSLLQLIILQENTDAKWEIPSLIIKDQPRFRWRAYMLDESRYFHGEEFVKRILDQMALLKMNVFHWHLIDDAGWRLEIKKYPKLTEIGSKRKDTEIGTWKSGKTSGEPHSGFYTQEQIKNIVAYAKERHITIVPEFEMPGHSSAAIAAYTWLGTAGKEIEVPVTFGRHYDNYDVTKPEVIQFIKDVLTEMFELFPSEVIHIGGDEVGYKVWEESEHVQQYMKEKGMNTAADLQVNFTNEISKFMQQKGRRMMGWNEIMGINVHKDFEEKKNDKEAETELARNVVVHFWKGNIDLMTQAVKNGYGVVNSIHSSTYLDYNYKTIGLKKAYDFNPIPKDLEEKYYKNIYGLGCQMWSEWTPTNADIEYQTFPRIAAYAEVGWTTMKNKDFDSFKIGLNRLQKYWDLLGINYAKMVD
ncbi:beta-N-acetylhexosaminidase [Aquimarina sediminis]|uniref:beta-N-acetylhexosaminidase n=1 Tax=Aquimarina sediminis TaxID=2070536 RepID=UPI000CA02ACD|nr:beta-N-acetylhexosaminidase [Aquimarina sediminis]